MKNCLKLALIPPLAFVFLFLTPPPTQAVYCDPPISGVWNITSACVIYETYNGTAQGNVVIGTEQAPVTVTIYAGKNLVWYPGNSITIPTGSSIIVQTGSQITQRKICYRESGNASGYAAGTTSTDPRTGGTLYLGIDQTTADESGNCPVGHALRENLISKDFVDYGTTGSTPFLATTYRYLLNLGFAVSSINNGVREVIAANNVIRILGDNLQICIADPCTLTPPEDFGNLIVERKVGIGIGSPRTLLDLYGSNPVMTIGHNVGNAGTVGLRFSHNIGTVEQKAGIFTAATGSWGRSHMYFALNNAADNTNVGAVADAKMTILNNGNVGIGETNPGYKLDVQGGITNSTQGFESVANPMVGNNAYFPVGIATPITSANYLYGAVTYIGQAPSNGYGHQFTYAAGNSDAYLAYGGGEVGIGTTGPAYKLDVIGSFRATTSIRARTTTAANGFVGFNAGDASNPGYIEWYRANGTTRTAYMGYSSGGANNLGINLENSAHLNINGGNVGIGTGANNPAAQLEVESGGATTVQINSNGSGAELHLQMINTVSGKNFFIGQVGTAGQLVASSVAGDGVIRADNANLRFSVNDGGSSSMMINTSGNIGMGVTSIGERLDLGNGNAKMGNGWAVGSRQGNNYRLDGQTGSISCTSGTWVGIGFTWAVAFSSAPRCSFTAGSFNNDDQYTTPISCGTTTGQVNMRQISGTTRTCSSYALAYGPTTLTDFDLAETYLTKDSSIDSGDVVCIDPDNNSHVIKCQDPYDVTAIGIVSTEPGLIIGDHGTPDSRMVGLQGRAPVKVTLENGPINRGDLLTPSATRPGYAMRATKAGQIIGKALQPFDGSSTVMGENAFDGIDEENIKKILEQVKETGEGQTMAFINISWWDPQTSLTSIDSFSLEESAGTYSISQSKLGAIDRIGVYAKMLIATIEAGVIHTKELIINGINVLTELNRLDENITIQKDENSLLEERINSLEKQLEDIRLQLLDLKSQR